MTLKEKMDLLEREAGEAQCPALRPGSVRRAPGPGAGPDSRPRARALADVYRANSARRREIEREQQALEAEIRPAGAGLAGQTAASSAARPNWSRPSSEARQLQPSLDSVARRVGRADRPACRRATMPPTSRPNSPGCPSNWRRWATTAMPTSRPRPRLPPWPSLRQPTSGSRPPWSGWTRSVPRWRISWPGRARWQEISGR